MGDKNLTCSRKAITTFKVSDEITAKEIENVIKEIKLKIDEDGPEISELFGETKKMIVGNTKTDYWKNAEITVCDSKSNEYIIRSGKGTEKFLVKKIEEKIKSLPLVFNRRSSKTITLFKVKEITKLELLEEKIRTQFEDIDDEEKHISNLFDESVKLIEGNNPKDEWKNAEITICDSRRNEYVIRSGEGKHKFLVKEIKGESKAVHLVKTSTTEEIYTKEITYDLIETIIAEKELTGTHKEQRDMIVLLEKAANYVKSEGKNKDWTNAKITIYDENNDKHVIESGTGIHKIVVNRCSDDHTIRVVN